MVKNSIFVGPKRFRVPFSVGYMRVTSSILALLSVFALYIVFNPLPAEAGILSSFSSFFGAPKAEEPLPTQKNLQKIDVLQAERNPDPSTPRVLADTEIIKGTALTSENKGFDLLATSTNGYDTRLSPDQVSLYTVHKGDTLPQVAKMFNVSVNTILAANDLKRGASIRPDQVLVILPISGITYTVKKGDTLKSIAIAYKTKADDIAQYNGLESGEKLVIGDELIIPDAEDSVVNVSSTPTSSGKKGTSASGGSYIDTSGYFTRPISGGVRTQGIHGHNGVDLASAYGTPVMAAASGRVVVASSGGWGGGYGSYIVIQHNNGTQTLYGHLSKVSVTVGQIVTKGQTIGAMGSTGRSTGTHLHFEVRGGKNPF